MSFTTKTQAENRSVSPGENIQLAIDDVSVSGGGIVTLKAGTHHISEPVKIKSNVTLQGEGTLASTLKTDSNIKMIEEHDNGLVNVTIQNLKIIGTNASHSGGIQLASYKTDHDNIKVLGVHVFETGWGVHIKGAKNVIIDRCNFSRNGYAGKLKFAHNLYLRRCYGATVSNSIFNNSISANGINISYSTDISVTNCEAIGNYFRGFRAADTDGFKVHGCVIAENGNVGLLANTEKVVTKNIDWQNNCVSNNGAKGVYARTGSTGTCKNNNSYGNSEDYTLPDVVAQSGNVSDSSIVCNKRKSNVDLADLRIGTDLESVMPQPVSGNDTHSALDFEKEFDAFSKMKWTEVFSDDGKGNWRDKWKQDGKNGVIKNTENGMDYASGTGSTNHDHEVLWTKESFKGDLRIEYDFTRLDTLDRNVCILYVQATGLGTEEFPTDIMAWSAFREMPKMSYYFKNMNALHVSYAVNVDGYIRARRYPILLNKKWTDTKVPPLYSGEGYFETNKTYRLTVIKKGSLFMMEVKGQGKRKLYGWDTSGFEPITEGRIGLRQMFQRRSLYANFKISRLQ
ncbi:MAG: DUF1961 family protein [Candidatus Latescibacteria bacterium]|nr:DUF1961 family protein [Candidatus Latescibacterota bacterium]MBT5828649.1 DUF1961 family protein [Candidatus Latescibacterota bacterium]